VRIYTGVKNGGLGNLNLDFDLGNLDFAWLTMLHTFVLAISMLWAHLVKKRSHLVSSKIFF